TYPRYYGLAFLEPVIESMLRRFYRRCDAIVAPSESMAQLLREQRMSYDVGIWTRGIDREIFHPGRRDTEWRRSVGIGDDVPVIGAVGVYRVISHPGRRDTEWRRSVGIGDDVPVIGFIGRLVMEKGLDVFSDSIDQLVARQVRHKVLVVGEGPAREWFQNRLPD